MQAHNQNIRFNKYFLDIHTQLLHASFFFFISPSIHEAMENDTGCINFQEYILRTDFVRDSLRHQSHKKERDREK